MSRRKTLEMLGVAEALVAVRVDGSPLGGEPGGVAVVALDEMLGGEATDGAVVAADAGKLEFGVFVRSSWHFILSRAPIAHGAAEGAKE